MYVYIYGHNSIIDSKPPADICDETLLNQNRYARCDIGSIAIRFNQTMTTTELTILCCCTSSGKYISLNSHSKEVNRICILILNLFQRTPTSPTWRCKHQRHKIVILGLRIHYLIQHSGLKPVPNGVVPISALTNSALAMDFLDLYPMST